MEKIQEKAEELSGHITDYVQTMYKLGIAKTSEKAAETAAFVITMMALTFFALIIFLIGGIGFGWWLGDLLNSRTTGFLLMAGFYLICLLVIFLIRKKFLYPMIRDRVVRKIYE